MTTVRRLPSGPRLWRALVGLFAAWFAGAALAGFDKATAKPPPKPAWAAAEGSDAHGPFVEIRAGGVVQRMRPCRTAGGAPFWIGEVPVTRAFFEAVLATKTAGAGAPDRPVDQVSYLEAERFCEALERKVPGLEVWVADLLELQGATRTAGVRFDPALREWTLTEDTALGSSEDQAMGEPEDWIGNHYVRNVVTGPPWDKAMVTKPIVEEGCDVRPIVNVRSVAGPVPVATQRVGFPGIGFRIAANGVASGAHAARVASARALAGASAGAGPRLVVAESHAHTFTMEFARDGVHAFSVDSGEVGDAAGKALVWDIAAGCGVRRVVLPKVDSALFSPAGDRIYTLDYEHRLAAYDTFTGERLFERQLWYPSPDADDPYGSLAVTPDGRTVIIDKGFGGEVLFRDAATGEPKELPWVPIAFSRDGARVVSAGGDEGAPALRVMELTKARALLMPGVATDREIARLAFPSDEGPARVALSPSGRLAGVVFAGASGGSLRAFDLPAGTVVAEGRLAVREGFHLPMFSTLEFTADDSLLVAVAHDALGVLDIAKRSACLVPLANPVNVNTAGRAAFVESAADLERVRSALPGFAVSLRRDPAGEFRILAFEPSGARMLATRGWAGGVWDGGISLRDGRTGAVLREFAAAAPRVDGIAFGPGGTSLVLVRNRQMRRLDLGTGRVAWSVPVSGDCVAFTADGSGVLTAEAGNSKYDALFDAASGRKLAAPVPPKVRWLGVSAQSADGKRRFAPVRDGTPSDVRQGVPAVYDVATGALVRELGRVPGTRLLHLAVSGDGRRLLAAGDEQGATVFDVESGGIIAAHTVGEDGAVRGLALSPDGSLLATTSQVDSRVAVRKADTGEILCRISLDEPGRPVLFTPDGYYAAESGAAYGLAFVVGDRAYPAEQLELARNRPDIVLARLGFASARHLAALKRAWEKRVERMGLRPADVGFDLGALPEVTIDRSTLPLSTSETAVRIPVKARDAAVELDHLAVSVNDVPVFGRAGLAVAGGAGDGRAWSGTVELPLSAGSNKIQLSVVNKRGVESLRETVYVACARPAAAPELHVVAIGVAEYADARWNLTYAAKDARDVARVLGADREAFRAVHPTVIADREATRERILAAKEALRKTTVDDCVVVFAAGHGLLDDRLDYWFATTDVDFAAPAKRGLAYPDLEDLVDGIPARNRLVLIDTCNSGEVEKEGLVAVDAAPAGADGRVKVRATRGFANRLATGKATEPEMALEFLDLRRGTGASVLTAAGGAEFSLESDRWKNGVFTYALLEALEGRHADRDGDRSIRISELHAFVTARVRELTGGRQTPRARVANRANDFQLVR